MTAFGDALRAKIVEAARFRAAGAAITLEQRLRAAAPPCREWVHDEPGRPFPPHEGLDGYAFETDDDIGLSTNGAPAFGFVGSHFHIGDHAGCVCQEVIVNREVRVDLVEDSGTRITYRATTTLARARMVQRPQRAGVLVGAGVAGFPDPPQAADVDLEDPALRSTWWRDTVATWPDLLR